MEDITSLTFIIRPADQDNVRGRAVRRIFISSNAMKIAKLFTGDVVVLSVTSDICQPKVGAHLLSENLRVPKAVLRLETVGNRDDMAVIRVSQ